jgi:hypothetical protein
MYADHSGENVVVTFVVLASMYQQHLIKSIDHIYTAESASPKGLFLSFTVLLGWAALFTAAFSVNFMIPPDPIEFRPFSAAMEYYQPCCAAASNSQDE